ncbi:hypothetical protein ACJMK2_012975 [Sinanodonta woodiana]|uniref:BTB domain-containing protein n=1 Tax=Sinanodonta woodiana TaxID=1069815 RepID=A0ABD3V9X4_SINWO
MNNKRDLDESTADDICQVKKGRFDQNMDVGPNNDWQSRKSLAECNREMFTREIAADVTFLVGKQKTEVKAHKYVLISRSCVFHEMLYRPDYTTPTEITIPDIEPDIFKQVLMFIYCEEITNDLDNVFAVLNVAKKYHIQSLIDTCLDRLKVDMTVYNISIILENARNNNNVELAMKCMAFILGHAKQVFLYSDLSKLSEECMTEIIKSDDLALSEQEIYEGLLKYAVGKCQKDGIEPTTENKKRILGGLLKHVRFPLMDRAYFTDVVSESGLLPQADVLKLLKHFIKPQDSILGYTMKKRKNKHSIHRFEEHATGWGYKRDKSDAIMISSSKDVLIHGVTVYGSCNGVGLYDAVVVIKGGSLSADMATKKVQLSTDIKEKVYEIFFDTPVLMENGKQYNIVLTMKGPASYYGEKGKTEIESEGVIFKFEKSKFSDNTTNEGRGQLPGIIFDVIQGPN